MAGSFSGANGCSLLVWVDTETLSDSSTTMEGGESHSETKPMLEDAVCLLGTRWGIDFTYMEHGGVLYAFGTQPRYPIGIATISRALGDLAAHIKVHRGGPHDTALQLIKYQECRRKYNVPETVHEDTYGEGSRESASQPVWPKKRRQ